MTSKREKRKEVYDAAAHWRDKCLVEDGSLFGDGSLWKKEYFGKEFAEMFDACHKINALMPRLKCQVKELPSKYHKLAVEMLWAMYLPNSSITPGGKRKNLQIIADVSGAKLPSGHDFLHDAPMHGLGKLGRPFYTNLWFEMMCLILCVREIKHLDPSERKRLLTASDSNDGTELSRLWDGWPEKWRTQWGEDWWEKNAKNRHGKLKKAEQLSIRHSMMHLFFPGHYEPAFSSGQKMQIVSFFNPSMDPEKMSWTEIDGAIRAIRKEQEKIHGTPLDFYDDPLWSLWRKGKKPDGNGGKITQSMLNIPLNQIFYGPPGTGKTYHTVNAALEILASEFYQDNEDDREALKDRFDELRKKGMIGFVTFHQSFGYEEFVEGIRPVLGDKRTDVAFEIRDGIFKAMCQPTILSKDLQNFDDAMDALKGECEEESITVDSVRRRVKYTVSLMEEGDAFAMHAEGRDPEKSPPLYIQTIRKLFAENSKLRGRARVRAILKYLRERHGLEDLKPAAKSVVSDGLPRVLIIDEINRGNISRIFGELITLIEESKRLDNDEAAAVELPYSGDTFGVPNNLYIIGTMNTADRSIALLDTALRRRFRFVEMMPDASVVKDDEDNPVVVEGVQIQTLLTKMNERIEALYDRDHQIGHSFFMKLKDEEKRNIETLAEIFQHEILPLLQEYFYDDWEKIDLVLNRNKFLEQKDPPKMPDGAVADDRKIWSIKKSELLVPANYQKIYDDAADDNSA